MEPGRPPSDRVAATTASGAAPPDAHPVMAALARRVPLTLLCDLLGPVPPSRDIYAAERCPGEEAWLRTGGPAEPAG